MTAEEFYIKEINPDNEKFKNDPIHKRIIKLMDDYAQLKKFKKPTNRQLVDIATIFCEDNGMINQSELVNSVGTADFIVDRLYDNGDVMIPSNKEQSDAK